MDVVTGAFSFTGRYIAARLLEDGREVRTLSRRAQVESPFGARVAAHPLDFADPDGLAAALDGADTLYNTYWIRYPRGAHTFAAAVRNTETLLGAARAAGVRRVVQLSVTGAAFDAPTPYFRAKAAAEEAARRSGLSCAVVRPTLVFGPGEVLLNNVAWLLRRLPLFVMPSPGRYAVQPVAAEDVAALCVQVAAGDESVTVDAAGPDVLAFEEVVRLVREAVGSRAALVRARPRVALGLCRALGALARETVLTREELAALGADLLISAGPPRGSRRLENWLRTSADVLGRSFASDRRRPWAR